ncbi:MAG: ABC transporter ATP-binding protein [Methanomassiliicoccus sp.]|nr:ABC transporter ATP-binding protein [Methanomassiliicoccus sp.]
MLEISGLNVGFTTSRGEVKAACDVSLTIEKGETFGMIGESGSGKSVIGMSILKLLPASARMTGSIFFDGEDLITKSERDMQHVRRDSIFLVPQNPSGSLDPLMKNAEQIAEVFYEQKMGEKEAWARSVGILRKLNLQDPERVARQYPHQLSGGMKQRILVGVSMTAHPRLIVADEPTKGLDRSSRDNVAQLLKGIGDEERALLVITHDIDLAEEICDKIAVIYAGEIIEMGRTEEVIKHPRHPYTQGLIRSVPKNGMMPMLGFSPNLTDLPPGCRFYDRCESAKRCAECKAIHPDLSEQEGVWVRCRP